MKIDKDKLRDLIADTIMALIAIICIGVSIWIWIGIFEWMIKHSKP